MKLCGLNARDSGAFAEYLTFEQDKDGVTQTTLHITLTASINETQANNSQSIRTEIRASTDDEGLHLDRDTRLYLSTTYLKPLRDADNELK